MLSVKQKYIRTKDNRIIVFPEFYEHVRFKDFEPVSAGFISIGANGPHEPTISCYGKSISLGLDSLPEEDTELAKRDILGEFQY